MPRIKITEDMKIRASEGLLTDDERQQIRDEMLYYRRHLIQHRKILDDLLIQNSKMKRAKLCDLDAQESHPVP